jgi:hypothetical protein
MSPDPTDLPADPERPRVPRALYEGLQLTRRAQWSPESIRAWWSWCLARTDPAMVAGVAGVPVLFLGTPEMVAFVDTSQRLDVMVYALKDKAHRQKRWDQYCFDVMTPQLLLESLEGCVSAGTLSREDVSRLQDACLMSVNAKGRWKPLTPEASPRAKE